MSIISLILVCIMSFNVWSADSLYPEEEIPLTNFYGVGARSMGMGGAQIACANDYSATYWNPAALVLIHNGQFQFGLTHQNDECNTTFKGNADAISLGKTRFNTFGFVFPFPVKRGNLVFAMGTQRIASFDSKYIHSGYDDQHFVYEDGDTLPNEGYRIEENIKQGGIRMYSLSGAAYVTPHIALGLGLDIYSGSLYSEWTYILEDTKNVWTTYPEDYAKYEGIDEMNADFISASMNLSMLINNGIMSAGVVLKMPVSYLVNSTYDYSDTWDYDNGEWEDDQWYEDYEDDILVPLTLGAGFAMKPGPFTIASDFWYTDWTQMEFNKRPVKNYNDEFRWHFGAEYQLPAMPVWIRSGFYNNPIVFETDNIVDDRYFISFGAGAIVDEVLGLDLAVTRGAWKLTTNEEERSTQRVYFNATYHF